MKRLVAFLTVVLMATLSVVSCGGGGGETPPVSAGQEVGPAGGTLTFANGVKLVFPAGAVDAPTVITVEDLPAAEGSLRSGRRSIPSRVRRCSRLPRRHLLCLARLEGSRRGRPRSRLLDECRNIGADVVLRGAGPAPTATAVRGRFASYAVPPTWRSASSSARASPSNRSATSTVSPRSTRFEIAVSTLRQRGVRR